MKPVVRKKYRKIQLVPFDIDSDNFLTIIESVFPPETSFQLRTGTASDEGETYDVVDIADARANITKIVSPFQMKIGQLNLDIKSSGASLEYLAEANNEILASGIVERLHFYQSWPRRLIFQYSSFFFFGTLALSVLVFFFAEKLSIYALVGAFIFLLVSTAYALLSAFIKMHPSVVKYRPRETIWERNAEKVFVALIVGTLMLLIGYLIP